MWAQKLLVARRAVEYGTTAAMNLFAKKYPELSNRLKETSVCQCKNLYQDYLQVEGDSGNFVRGILIRYINKLQIRLTVFHQNSTIVGSQNFLITKVFFCTVLVIIDNQSKWIEAIPLCAATASSTVHVNALRLFFANFGLPKR